jgi:hypothetical protein
MNALWLVVAGCVGWLSGYSYVKHGPGKLPNPRNTEMVDVFGAAWIQGLQAGWEGSRLLVKGATSEAIGADAQRRFDVDFTNQVVRFRR